MNRMNVYTKHNRLCIVNVNTCIEHYVDMPSQLVPLDVCSMTLAYCENSRGKPTITTQSHVHVCNVCPVLVLSVQATRNYRPEDTIYDLCMTTPFILHVTVSPKWVYHYQLALLPHLPVFCSLVCAFSTRKRKSVTNGEGLGIPIMWMTSSGCKVYHQLEIEPIQCGSSLVQNWGEMPHSMLTKGSLQPAMVVTVMLFTILPLLLTQDIVNSVLYLVTSKHDEIITFLNCCDKLSGCLH